MCPVSEQIEPIWGLAGAFLRPAGVARATLVAGDTEVNLDIGTCGERSEPTGHGPVVGQDVGRRLASTS